MPFILSLIGALLVGASTTPPARMPRGAGWQVGSVRLEGAASGCARCVQTESWASSVRYLDPPNQIPPWRTLARLQRHALLVHITRGWEPSPPRWIHRRRPLIIDRNAIFANFEGNSAGRASRWSTSTWRAGSYVTAWVFFGAPQPSAADVARAQGVLDRTVFPLWHVDR